MHTWCLTQAGTFVIQVLRSLAPSKTIECTHFCGEYIFYWAMQNGCPCLIASNMTAPWRKVIWWNYAITLHLVIHFARTNVLITSIETQTKHNNRKIAGSYQGDIRCPTFFNQHVILEPIKLYCVSNNCIILYSTQHL